ncbi:MAG: S41 family peptidase [Ekhidna sp.]
MAKLITLTLFFMSCLAGEGQYPAHEVKEDLTYLQSQLETYHPGFYRYTSKMEMADAFEKAIANGGMSDLGLYANVKFLLGKIGCGHTRAQMSDRMGRDIELNQVFMPLTVKLIGEKVFIDKTLDSQLQSGQEIISINGVSIQDIKKKIGNYIPSDGFIETGKLRMAELLFDGYYQLYVDPTARSYELKVKNELDEETVFTVGGVPNDQIEGIRKQYKGDLLSLEYSGDFAYMRIKTFGSQSLQRDGYDYKKFLKTSFKELKNKETANLILDLRGNGGGRDNYGALLVSYLAKDSYGYFDNIQVTENYPGRSTKVGNTYFMTSHEGLSVWQPQKDRFNGDVYVLIDGFSFSTCADVATVLHHHGWATFLGEETGGGYDGNTSGRSKSIILPNSKISVSIPMWMYTTANVGHAYMGRGVIPDYPVFTSWEEYVSGVDAVLEKAKSLIDSK